MLRLVDISTLAMTAVCLGLTGTTTVTARQICTTGFACCRSTSQAAKVPSNCCSSPDTLPPVAMKQSPDDDAARKSEKPKTDRVMLGIEGMTGEACLQAVAKVLLGMKGVTAAEVNYDSGLAYVVFNVDGAPTDEAFAEAVTKAGFAASVRAPSYRSSNTPAQAEQAADCCATTTTGTDDETDCYAPIDTSRQTINVSDKALAELSLISLEASLDPFIERFNAERDRVRVVALVSPTCGGCVEGARAVQKSIIERYPDADLSVHVIWEPMIATDNLKEAKRSSIIFPDLGVHQYYDPERRSGRAYLEDLFPDYRKDIAASATAEHRERWKLDSDESGPLWDLYLVYEPGVQWGDTTPTPAAWVKQVLYFPDRSGLMWADDFSAPPLESNLQVEVGNLMTRLERANPQDATAPSASALNLQLLTFPSCPNGPVLRDRLVAALGRIGLEGTITDVNLEELATDDPRLCYGAPTIYLNGRDLMGAAPLKAGALCCRTYELGQLPDVDALVAQLGALHRPDR